MRAAWRGTLDIKHALMFYSRHKYIAALSRVSKITRNTLPDKDKRNYCCVFQKIAYTNISGLRDTFVKEVIT